jgi:teichuronic acid biosynthesis glycosyltransferase TuaC
VRILWTHNFDPNIREAGVFMHEFASHLRSRGLQLDTCYLGKLSSPRDILSAIANVRRVSANYDIVHAQYGSMCAFVSSFAGSRRVVTLRGSDWHVYRGGNWKQRSHSLVATAITRSVLGRFNAVISVSNRIRNEVLKHSPGMSLVTIPDPINTDLFIPRSKEASRLRAFGSVSRDLCVLFTTLDRQNPIKRVGLAEEAIEILRKSHPAVRLVVATGVRHCDMPHVVASCDVALCTSTHEGWPNSIKEALACNVPFVATDVSDLSDLAQTTGNCAVVRAEPQAIAGALKSVFDRRDSSNLRRHVESMNQESSCNKLLDLYNRMLKSE